MSERTPLRRVDAEGYRVRAAGSGLDELDGGDRWRVQVWPTAAGRLLVGAEPEDARHDELARPRAAPRTSSGTRTACSGSTRASTTRRGTPQLEELAEAEAGRRYPDRASWGAMTGSPTGSWIEDFWKRWRSSGSE